MRNQDLVPLYPCEILKLDLEGSEGERRSKAESVNVVLKEVTPLFSLGCK
jgi:hypothetical protein